MPTLIFICCKTNNARRYYDKTIDSSNSKVINEIKTRLTTSKDSVFSNDFAYYGDSILTGHKDLLSYYFKKYVKDECIVQVYKKKNVKDGFEGFKKLGDINNNKKTDSVFVLEPLNWCEYDDGDSYYFTDTTLPRLKSGSYCCHPSNFFKTKDIDEDGVCEVGVFYSSCSSRYKSIQLYRLKNKTWEQIGASEFDILTQDPTNVNFETLVEKISKNKLRMKNFMEGKKYWDTITIR